MKDFFKKNKFYLISTFTLLGINAAIYFFSKYLNTNFNLIGTTLDNKIPFIPEFIYIYMIWYPFLIISFYILYKYDKNQYLKLLIIAALSLLISYIIFIFYPTTINRPLINNYNDITSFIVYTTFKADTPVNCFPSCHCLLCFILLFNTVFNKKISLTKRTIITTFNILIIISTLLVKQHVIYDVIGAFIISLTVTILVNILQKK